MDVSISGRVWKSREKGVQKSKMSGSVNTIRVSADAIRISADSLILSASSLIVFEGGRKGGGNGVEVRFSCSLILCCHIVTLSHSMVKVLKSFVLCVWQRGDNKNEKENCCHAFKMLVVRRFCLSVTTWQWKIVFYRVWYRCIGVVYAEVRRAWVRPREGACSFDGGRASIRVGGCLRDAALWDSPHCGPNHRRGTLREVSAYSRRGKFWPR